MTGDDPEVDRTAVDRAYANWVLATKVDERMLRPKEVSFMMAGAILGMVIPAVILAQWWLIPCALGGALSGFWVASSDRP